MRYAVAVKKLTLCYGAVKVIDSANFEVERGDFVCIVGANGSGKSTLVKAILGLLKPSAGKVLLGDGIRRESIGFLPQETKTDLNFPATVYEIVLSGTLGRLRARMLYRKEDKERAMKALKRVGILKLKEESFASLSGGQKQKVLLARALAATSEILILDEPSNNLDHKSRKEFYETLKGLNAAGLTIIMITHDLDVEDLIGNKILSIREGKVECSPTEEYLGRFR